jgi:hypothetical protein
LTLEKKHKKDAIVELKVNNTEDCISFLQNAYDEVLAIHL